MRKPTTWVPTRSDTNQAVQSQKQARSLKFWVYVEEELYYPCSEAHLRLCFRLCRLLVFPCSGYYKVFDYFFDRIWIKRQANLHSSTCRVNLDEIPLTYYE